MDKNEFKVAIMCSLNFEAAEIMKHELIDEAKIIKLGDEGYHIHYVEWSASFSFLLFFLIFNYDYFFLSKL